MLLSKPGPSPTLSGLPEGTERARASTGAEARLIKSIVRPGGTEPGFGKADQWQGLLAWAGALDSWGRGLRGMVPSPGPSATLFHLYSWYC